MSRFDKTVASSKLQVQGGAFVQTTHSMKSSGQTLGNDEAAKASLPPSDVMRSNPADPTKFTGSSALAPTNSSQLVRYFTS